jgi:hypothetical protein
MAKTPPKSGATRPRSSAIFWAARKRTSASAMVRRKISPETISIAIS